MTFKYIVVDDEKLARKLIMAHASKIDSLVFCGEFGSATDATSILGKSSIDVIFLDIQMPELTGLEFIRTLKNAPAIILTTAHREFGADAFELDVLDYLVKPISFERFVKAFNKLSLFRQANDNSARVEESPDILYIKSDRKIYPVDLAEILFIESLDNYVKIHLRNRTFTTRENITNLESKLPSPAFVRIHRSFIVARKHIESISAEVIQVAGRELPVGRAFRQSAMESLR